MRAFSRSIWATLGVIWFGSLSRKDTQQNQDSRVFEIPNLSIRWTGVKIGAVCSSSAGSVLTSAKKVSKVSSQNHKSAKTCKNWKYWPSLSSGSESDSDSDEVFSYDDSESITEMSSFSRSSILASPDIKVGAERKSLVYFSFLCFSIWSRMGKSLSIFPRYTANVRNRE